MWWDIMLATCFQMAQEKKRFFVLVLQISLQWKLFLGYKLFRGEIEDKIKIFYQTSLKNIFENSENLCLSKFNSKHKVIYSIPRELTQSNNSIRDLDFFFIFHSSLGMPWVWAVW